MKSLLTSCVSQMLKELSVRDSFFHEALKYIRLTFVQITEDLPNSHTNVARQKQSFVADVQELLHCLCVRATPNPSNAAIVTTENTGYFYGYALVKRMIKFLGIGPQFPPKGAILVFERDLHVGKRQSSQVCDSCPSFSLPRALTRILHHG